jgi:hypothetical protein
MGLKLARIVVFTNNLTTMTAFYRSVLDLEVVIDEKGYKELDGGGCRIALQSGSSKVGMKAPKLVFFAPDVEAQRERLVRRGAKFMPVHPDPVAAVLKHPNPHPQRGCGCATLDGVPLLVAGVSLRHPGRPTPSRGTRSSQSHAAGTRSRRAEAGTASACRCR